MTKKKIIGFKSGYMSGPTNPGDQWTWGRRIDSAGGHSTQERNGGLWIVLNSSFDEMSGDTWLNMMIPKSETGHSSVLYNWKVDVVPTHPGHYEDGPEKYFKWSDPRAYQYQAKITSEAEYEEQYDNLLTFESYGKRKTIYSWVWTSYADDATPYNYVKDAGYEPVDLEEKNAWWGHTVQGSENASKSKTAAKGWGDPKNMKTSRLRNVVGFTMNGMIKGDSNSYMHPSSIGLLMNNGGSTMRLVIPTEKFGNSHFLTQKINASDHWNNNLQNKTDAALWKQDGVKAKVFELNYVCTADVISEIVSGKWELMGIWMKFSTQNTSSSGYGWKGMGFWNFRPIVCGADGSVGTTWNNNTYNILSDKRRYVDNASLYMV